MHNDEVRPTLNSGRNTLLLEASNILGRQLSSKEGIFGEGLKVASSKRVSMHADSWGKKHIRGSRSHFVGKVVTNLTEEGLVPGRSQGNATGKEGGL